MKSIRKLCAIALGSLALSSATRLSAEVLFHDTLDTAASASQWKTFVGYYAGGDTNDFSVQWGFDYSQQQYDFYSDPNGTPETRTVPPPPHSDGSTFGLKVAVNKLVNSDPNAREAFGLSLYPIGQNFSGDFVLKFDLFMSYSGYAGTANTTTEYANYGINFVGDKVNWTSPEIDPAFTSGPGAHASDGLWFINSGDGYARRNFRGLQGGPFGEPVLARTTSAANDPDGDSIFLDRDGDGFTDNQVPAGGPFSADLSPYIQRVFPQPAAEFRGTVGKSWIPVEVSQYKGVITWKMNGWVISTYTNSSSYTSGTIMLGYMDIFDSIPDPADGTWAIFDNVRVERIRTVVVDTADNNSTAGDGKTSLLEALQQLDDNDIITFNIPGAGPHYIATPLGGYPLITKNNVTIDGYSQPGASPNTATIHSPNDAKIKIVLDSRNGGTTSLADYGDHGFGSSESAILPLLGVQNFTLRGVSVLSISGEDSDESPYIYGVAMIKDVGNLRIQGNWFGVDPGTPTAAGVSGGRSALAGFKWDDDTFSSNVVFGTDSDGLSDLAEHNVVCGQLLALHLQTPNVRVAGNFFNFLPNGSIFDYAAAGVDLGGDGTYEFFENGAGSGNIIGTDSDTINDADEANFVGPIRYDHYMEFWRPATNVVVAGNSFGFGLESKPSYTNAEAVALIAYRELSTLRVGSSFRGDPNGQDQAQFLASDLLAFNHIANLGKPALSPGNNNNDPDKHSWVIFAGNEMINNFGILPIDPASGVLLENSYAGLLADPANANAPIVSTNSTINHLQGTLPALADTAIVDSLRIFIWLADTNSLAKVSPDYPNGWVQGNVYVGEFTDNGLTDNNPNPDAFDVDLSLFGLALEDVERVFVVAEYKLTDGREATIQYSNPVGSFLPPGDFILLSTPVLAGDTLSLSWTGGHAPFKVQTRTTLTAAWTDVTTVSATTANVSVTGTAGFYRVLGN
ncbi:MAG TPA: hypothetical protein VMF06_08675 [Candidatus Limnocylindria bacterium]|jgi:hypothetical protein|nr:hypothetical protein [Candidatus Limnocylindria bacterium]